MLVSVQGAKMFDQLQKISSTTCFQGKAPQKVDATPRTVNTKTIGPYR